VRRELADLAGIVLAHRAGVPVRLANVARVEDGTEEVRSAGPFQAQGVVVLAVTVRPGRRSAPVLEVVRRTLGDLRASLPPGVVTYLEVL